jgi:hypothetical protein
VPFSSPVDIVTPSPFFNNHSLPSLITGGLDL